jgi:hypothetical protein
MLDEPTEKIESSKSPREHSSGSLNPPSELTGLCDGGHTVLSLAVMLGCRLCIAAVLESVQSTPLLRDVLLARDTDGSTPFHHAVEKEDADAVTMLLAAAPEHGTMYEMLTTPRQPDLLGVLEPEADGEVAEAAAAEYGDGDFECDTPSEHSLLVMESVVKEAEQQEKTAGHERRPVARDCPVVIAAGLVNGLVLEAIMRFMPQLWQQEKELGLLQVRASAMPPEAHSTALVRFCSLTRPSRGLEESN